MSNLASIADNWLRDVIKRDQCVLSFDRSLLDQLSDILTEQYGINTIGEVLARWPELAVLLGPSDGSRVTEEGLSAISSIVSVPGVDVSAYETKTVDYPHADAFSAWTGSSVTSIGGEGVLRLHQQLGRGDFALEPTPYSDELELVNLRGYLKRVTPAPHPRPSIPRRIINRLLKSRALWEVSIRRWQKSGLLDSSTPSLSIGPRWLTEVRFFRDVMGLSSHKGLDLFSADPELVLVGDMHQIPIEDESQQLVFIKNTLDKSYDFRRVIGEIRRVLRPGGILVIDQVCGYGICTPLTRTDIQNASAVGYVLRRNGFEEVLVSRTTSIQPEPAPWAAPTRNLVQLAVQRR